MDPNAGSFELGLDRILREEDGLSEEGAKNSLLGRLQGRLQQLGLGGETRTGSERRGLSLQWGQSVQGAQLQLLNSSQLPSSIPAQATFQGNYNQSQTSYNWAQPAQPLGYLPPSAFLARNFNGLPLTVGSPIVGERREPVEDIQKEILELEEQVEQEYKEFCYHRSIRHGRKVNLDNLKEYIAVLEQSLFNTCQRNQQLQIKLLFGADIGDQFEKLVARQLTHVLPTIEQRYLRRNWKPIRGGKRPLPRFPPGGPIYLNRAPKLFKIQIKIVVKVYTILEGSLCVCKITEQEYEHSIDVASVHELQEYQFEKVCTETEYYSIGLPVYNRFLPTTREGVKIAVRSFARVIERLSYFFCFDPPLSPDAVRLENPVAKDKDLGKWMVLIVLGPENGHAGSIFILTY
ncbi:uncharacterized protein EAE98_000158 [Botrytis deweyae]|uniref:SAP domain-containing protein n=1 Tax=Botrytis deweyae TaxID=2478750 RepID=A0ABQ7J202_9HELO|nr:uncharacterized protein EAE98_000158 [Botrytis deweyae]KAF7940031.1 hypothetical protein EAE98_000158 [Botrytis deweyae]